MINTPKKQLGFERTFDNANNEQYTSEYFREAIQDFLSASTGYMQYATMLKTSFRFVASMALNTEGLTEYERRNVSEVISLIAIFRNNADLNLMDRVKSRIDDLKSTLKSIESKKY